MVALGAADGVVVRVHGPADPAIRYEQTRYRPVSRLRFWLVTPVIFFAVWRARLHFGYIDYSGAVPILVPMAAVGTALIMISNELWRRRAPRYPGRLWVSRLAYLLGPGESD